MGALAVRYGAPALAVVGAGMVSSLCSRPFEDRAVSQSRLQKTCWNLGGHRNTETRPSPRASRRQLLTCIGGQLCYSPPHTKSIRPFAQSAPFESSRLLANPLEQHS